MRLVADIGGTNSRLALSRAGTVVTGSIQSFSNADWAGLEGIIEAYLASQGTIPKEMVIALAGPVHGDKGALTNRNWLIEADKLAGLFDVEQVHLLNDLTALGYSVPHLDAGQVQQIDQGRVQSSSFAQSLVIGIGTGFNVSPVYQNGRAIVCPAVEAGHVTLPSGIANLLSKFDLDASRYPTVEDLFSGRGFASFCQHVCADRSLDGPTAIAAYGKSDSETITYAVDGYAALLGQLSRDLSLAYLPVSGLYFAGSVARSVLGKSPDKFVKVLQEPSKIMRTDALPLLVIEDDTAALIGCAGFQFP